jgi:hypothetical protein
MYGHHVVDDFNALIKKQLKDETYLDAIKSAVVGIKQAQHFFLGSYQELIQPLRSFVEEQKETQVFLGSSSKYVRLPYKSCWFEFEDNSFTAGETMPVPKRGLLVDELDEDLFRVVIVNWVEQWKRWVLSPQNYLVLVGRTFGDDLERIGKKVAAAAVNRGVSPSVVNLLMRSNTYPMSASDKQLPWDTALECRADDQRDLYVLNAALLLLNCKNIETEDNQPPSKLNRKRSKNGKQELFTYKTLVLRLPSNRKQTHGNDDVNNNITRIHLCRGHFKIFTEDAPLFGRYTGLYWWDPHVRGDKTKGLVVKDYIVRSDQ